MLVNLPGYRITKKVGKSKNTLNQLLIEPEIVDVSEVLSSEIGLKIMCSGRAIYLVGDKNILSSDIPYVLYSNEVANIDRVQELINESIWIRHPKLIESTPEEIVSTWENNFYYLESKNEDTDKGLRKPQIGALHSIIGHLRMPVETGTIVLPTGTGKTEVMLSCLIAERPNKLLVVVPSNSLRRQIADKFISLGLLRELGIVNKNITNPKVGIVNGGFKNIEDFKNFFAECNVLVGTMSAFNKLDNVQLDILEKNINLVFIDEAHHSAAATWEKFRIRFNPNIIIQFTATPFRNDGKRLDGKVLFNFPLKEAQKLGYYKEIKFIPIVEWDNLEADKKIAEKAIETLKSNDIQILMARCATKDRADEVYKIYQKYTEYNPVRIYSDIEDFNAVYEKIINRESRIIVCVDMLGEGFDLPELKIAAFHDIKKSLPITLQFVGRFTRKASFDALLGNASFIANIANPDVEEELSELYACDADWNDILSNASHAKIKEEIDYKKFMGGFTKLTDKKLPFQNIRLKLSTVVYYTSKKKWQPNNFPEGIKGFDNLEYSFFDINEAEKILIIITASNTKVDWINHKDIYTRDWKITTVFFDETNHLLFINSSDNGSIYQELAKAVMGEDVNIIKGIDVFKSFHNINRIRLQNVGLKQHIGKGTSFRNFMGSNVWLTKLETGKSEKSYVSGSGFEEGEKISIGASTKGRIWTKMEDELPAFKEWCLQIGKKLIDKKIKPSQILENTLIPEQKSEIPDFSTTHCEWDESVYDLVETNFRIEIGGKPPIDLTEMNIVIDEYRNTKNTINFFIEHDNGRLGFELKLFQNNSNRKNPYADYKIKSIDGTESYLLKGRSSKIELSTYFQEFPPTIYFVNGASIRGTEYFDTKQTGIFNIKDIETWDWVGEGVNIAKEPQGFPPYEKESIQYYVLNKLKSEGNYDLIYDDDGTGEMADIITMKRIDEVIKIQFYHLKAAYKGIVGTDIRNIREVCGQAQVSAHWKHADGKKFHEHLLKRLKKTKVGVEKNCLEKGSLELFGNLLQMIKKRIGVELEIIIVQPGISKAKASLEVLTTLGVTESYLEDTGNIKLRVIASP